MNAYKKISVKYALNNDMLIARKNCTYYFGAGEGAGDFVGGGQALPQRDVCLVLKKYSYQLSGLKHDCFVPPDKAQLDLNGPELKSISSRDP